MILRLTLAECF